MFLRQINLKKEGRSYSYLKVVENVWENGRAVQRTLLNFGNVSSWPPGKLQELVGQLSRFLGMKASLLSQVRLSDCRRLGPYLPLSRLWDRLDLDGIMGRALSSRKADARVLACAKAMTLSRLVEPASKKAVWESVGRDIEIPGVDGESLPLQSYYRALEYLVGAKRQIEKAVHRSLVNLFNQDVSVVFYDVTSAYFEGKRCAIARHGYSREHRPDLLQIQIGLLVDSEGLPIGHEVFDGNLKDVTTVIGTLARLKEDFGVVRCVFIGDDGIASEANLAEVQSRGYEYITSLALGKSAIARDLLRSLPGLESWERIGESLWFRPLRTEGRVRYIGTYNPQRAQEMWERRKERISFCLEYLERLRRGPKPRGRKRTPEQILIAAGHMLSKKGCEKFIRVERGESAPLKWKLDRNALRHARRMDGMLILKTNSKTLSDAEVARGYRTLWRVEDAFRHIKDHIGLRPIRHWNDTRVLGHVFVCVLAYILERLYERELEKAGLGVSARRALEELRSIAVATLDANGQRIRRRSEITPRQQRLLAAAGVAEVPELW